MAKKIIAKRGAQLVNAQTLLQNIQTAFREADKLIEDAYDAAPRGEPVDVLLDLVAHRLLPDATWPMRGDEPTQADAEKTHDALFAPIAALQGAIALGEGSVIHPNLERAHKLLDQAQNDLDPCAALPALLPAQTADENAFLRGQGIALSMLGEATAMGSSDESSAWRQYRNGEAQDNFVKGYLADVLEDLALVDGFTATLSAVLSDDAMTSSKSYKLPMAEFMAGEVGADGTFVDDDFEHRKVPSSRKADRRALMTPVLKDALYQADNVAAVIYAAAKVAAESPGHTAALWGLHTMAKLAAEEVHAASAEPSENAWNEAALLIEQTQALCLTINHDGVDNATLHAAATLLELTMAAIQAETETCI